MKNAIQAWLERHDRNATWLGKHIGLRSSQAAAFVGRRRMPNLAQRIAIETETKGHAPDGIGVGRFDWPDVIKPDPKDKGAGE